MIAIASVVIVVVVSLLITRVATVALVLTGLSRDSARFQARSALSGTGFTTTEAESVVGHPVRRRIAMALMLSYTGTEGGQAVGRTLALVGGLLLVWFVARSAWVDRRLSWLIAKVLDRWTSLEARDYGALLHLSDRFAVGEIAIRADDWLAERSLDELQLRDEGVVVLGVTLGDGTWVGSPTFDMRLRAGDRAVAYGSGERLAELDHRRSGPEGNRAHEAAVEEHRERMRALADDARLD